MRLQNTECWGLQTCTEVCALPTKWIDCPAEKGAMTHSRRHGPRPEEKRGVKLRTPYGRGLAEYLSEMIGAGWLQHGLP